jgi:hypothetical protein
MISVRQSGINEDIGQFLFGKIVEIHFSAGQGSYINFSLKGDVSPVISGDLFIACSGKFGPGVNSPAKLNPYLTKISDLSAGQGVDTGPFSGKNRDLEIVQRSFFEQILAVIIIVRIEKSHPGMDGIFFLFPGGVEMGGPSECECLFCAEAAKTESALEIYIRIGAP